MPVKGEGTYGCVHSPSLKCESTKKIDYKNMVSKTLIEEEADKELKELSLLKIIDKENKYYLGYPLKCKPQDNKNTIKELKKCSNREKFLNYGNKKLRNETSLLIMKDGGVSLDDYIYTLSKNMVKANTQDNIEVMFINFMNVIRGVKFLVDNKLSHRDLKEGNIVYNEETHTMRMIDFGMLEKFSIMKSDAKKNDYFPGNMWWSVPIYACFLNKNIYETIKSKLKKNYSEYSNKLQEHYGRMIENDTGNINILFFRRITKKSNEIKTMLMKELDETFQLILSSSHSDFIKKYCKVCDVNNLGMILLNIITKLEPEFEIKGVNKILSKNLLNDIRILGNRMISFNLKQHIEIDEVLREYERILLSNNYLERNGYKVNRDKMVVIDNASPQEQPDVLLVSASPKRDDTLIDLDGCPEGKERNPITRRCVNVCKGV